MGDEFIKWFSELSNKDIAVAGGKGASLAEMYNNNFPIPQGFIITAGAYTFFIEYNSLQEKINSLLISLDIQDTEQLQTTSRKIRELIESSSFPKELEEAIKEAYSILDIDKNQLNNAKGSALSILKTGHEPPFVAVRSSATTEDLADASFAGQQDSFLNVKGEKELLKKVKECFSSLFTARAVYYRAKKKFAHEQAKLAVVVQRMVDSEKSGVIFSRNPTKGDNTIVIEAGWGLGEGVVSGKIKPDYYVISRELDNLKILDEKISDKRIAITRTSSGKNDIVKLTEERSKQRTLSNYELKCLAQYAIKLEEHYSMPQDIEFAIEGKEIYILQSRPITALPSEQIPEEKIQAEVLLNGLGASPGINVGIVKIIHSAEELSKIKPGDILVTEMTNPDMVVAMQKAAAIITDEGGLTSHAAIVSREMGIPSVVGTGNATQKLKDGQIVTVDGYSGKVYAGRGEVHLAEVKYIIPTRTKIKLILDIPEAAERAAKTGIKSIGLVRLEGIIAKGGKHPLKFLKENKEKEYISLLSAGLEKISQLFEEIWIRTSDLRSDEFAHLQGAPKEQESNPMLGDHGIRFSLRYPAILKAELTSIKEVADDYPNKTFGIMVPQIISLSELKETKRIANEEIGMPKNVKIGIMVETPAAVQQINQFCEEGISFISFGTNDLTQYMLAIDRNNSDVQYLFDEMHPAVLSALSYVIRRCKKYGVETSICGQAGSREEMVKFLISEGIDSISLNADAAYKVSKLIEKIETQKPLSPQSQQPQVQETQELQKIPIEEPSKAQAEELINEQSKEAQIPVETKDIEQAVLEALNNDDYQPGLNNRQSDAPPLHEPAAFDPELLEEELDKEELDLSEDES